MVAARILDASFSMTLHGSDLLVRADYLDIKLAQCSFCFTISEFNRRHILRRYPLTDPPKVLVQHLGIDATFWRDPVSGAGNPIFSILSVGRLHAMKNHGFLILACHALKNSGILFRCAIAGEGEEHGSERPHEGAQDEPESRSTRDGDQYGEDGGEEESEVATRDPRARS